MSPLDRLSPVEPQPEPLIPIPEPAELLGGSSCAPWLREYAEALAACASPCFRAAAVGVLGRLGPHECAAPARAWRLGLSAEQLEAATADLVRQVEACDERIARLVASVEAGLDGLDVLCALVDLRDVLESAAWALGLHAGPVRELLELLDEAARDRVVAHELPPGWLGELAAEVAWREPWAWWGTPGDRGVGIPEGQRDPRA